jgi:gliding motility-associated-like protein
MKALFILPIAVFTFFLANAQAPINDDCAGIIDLGEVPYCSQVAQFTNVNATTSNIDPSSNVPSCWNNLGDRDVWFQFSLPVNGSIIDISIDVFGNIAGNGTLKMPQLAVYRGDCELGGLAELACVVAPLNVNEVHLNLFGLTPGVPYFLRINDYSATATPNAGTFKLCVEPYVPDLNMGDAPGTAGCSGTLWDSGGPDGDYLSNENESFVICPTEFHQCIILNFEFFATEPVYDEIRVFAGDGTGGNQIQTIDGSGANFQLQIPSNCATIQFISDNSVQNEGFKLTWQCSPDICDAPPPTLPSNATCDQALPINGCDNTPQVMPLSPGQGDPGFIQTGINAGCFLAPSDDYNFSFFYFQAEANGKFGFAVQSANPLEATDIDFNVWGPINSVADICNFVSTNQPIRSSWDEGSDLTGLADIHPVFGTSVNDNFDCGSPATPGTDPPSGTADDFVRRLNVLTGQIYVIMLDDFNGTIENDGIAIDFSGTTDGVLGPVTEPIEVSNDTFSCSGAPVQLQVTGGLAYAWFPSAGLSCNTCPNPFASPNSTTTYEVKVVAVCQNVTEMVTIKTDPILNVQNDTILCNGQSVALGQTIPEQGVTYSWLPNDGSLSDPSVANPVATPLQTTVYTLTATSGSCVKTASVTIQVLPVPMLTITPASPQLCIGETTPLLVGNTTGLTNPEWSPQIGLSCITCINPTAAPASTTTYQFIASVGNGCSATASVVVEVNQPPVFQFPMDTICAGVSILLNEIADPTTSYTWTSNPPGFVSSEAQPIANPTQTTTYLVTLENGCTVQKQFNVRVIPSGNLVVSDDGTVCAGVSAQLVASGSYPGTYVWSNGGTGQVTSVLPAVPTTYYVTYNYPLPSGQCQAIDSVMIGVQGEVGIVQFPADSLLCPGEGVVLNTIATPGATYTWTSLPSGFTSNEATPAIVYPEASTAYLVETTLGNCIVNYEVDITVFNPQMMVTADTTICAGESVTIAAEALLTGSYLWTPGGSTPTFQDTLSSNSQYFLQFMYGEGCVYEDSVQVLVVPNFTIKLVSDPDTNRVNVGEPILLDAFIPGTNVSNFSFEWLENNMDPVGTTQQITITPLTLDSSITYVVTAVSPAGCIQTESITFTIIQPNIKVPNAFTPNGDGANDSFGLAIVEGIASVEKMEIYSRWGQKVFSSSDPNARWDGTIDGQDAPSDVYIFVIYYRGGDGALKLEKGDLTLLR